MNDPNDLPADDRKNLDQISEVLFQARQKVTSFYDCRMVLAVMISQASNLAAAMRQTGVVTPAMVVEYFTLGLRDSFVDSEHPPIVNRLGEGGGSQQ